MAYTLTGSGMVSGQNQWKGASGSETYDVLYCIVVSEDGSTVNDVVDVDKDGETALSTYNPSSKTDGRSIITSATWDGTALDAFKAYWVDTYYHVGWQVDSGNRPSFTAANGFSIFMAVNDLDAPGGNTVDQYGWGGAPGSTDFGFGWDDTPVARFVRSSSERVTGTTTLTTSGKCSLGGIYAANDSSSAIWYVSGDGTTATNTFEGAGDPGNYTADLPYVTGRNGGNNQNISETFCILCFNEMLSGDDFKLLHNDWFNELIGGGNGGLSIPVAMHHYTKNLG